MGILCILLTIYWVILIVRIISSWFRPPLSGPLHTVWRIVYDLTDPVLRPFRNILPAVRMGSMAVDFSPIIVFVILGVLQQVVCR